MITKARLFVVTMMLGGVAMGQGSEISSAILADRRDALAEAKEAIDEAAAIVAEKGEDEVSKKNMQKFYYHRGLIYQKLSVANPTLEGITTAIESYRALIAFDTKVDDDKYLEESQTGLTQSIDMLNNLAESVYFEQQDPATAYDLYSQVYELKSTNSGTQDTATLYTLARVAGELGNDEAALSHYIGLTEAGYKGRYWMAYYDRNGDGEFSGEETTKKTPMPDKHTMDMLISQGQAVQPELSEDINYVFWVQAANLAYKGGDTAKAMELLAGGLVQNPGNTTLANMQLQYLLDAGDYEQALANFEKSLETDPNNATFLYNVGYIYQTKMAETDKALQYYDRAIAADTTNLNSAYMAGYIFIDKTNVLTEQINELPRNARSEYDRLMAERKSLYEKALEYFSTAYEIDNTDLGTVKALREVYFKLGNAEKVGEMTRRMQELEAQQ